MVHRLLHWPPEGWDEFDLMRDDETRLPTQLYPFRLEDERDEDREKTGSIVLIREGGQKDVRLGKFADIWTAYRAMLDAYEKWFPTRPTPQIYFIGEDMRPGTLIKVGYSTNPQARLRQLQTSSGVKLHILATRPGTKRDEEAYHRRWKSRRQKGEWFINGDCIIAEIERLRSV